MADDAAQDTTQSQAEQTQSTRRLRLIQAGTLLILIIAFAGTIYLLGDEARREQLEAVIVSPGGLLVLFAVAAISNATLILPAPGLALTALAATVVDPLVVGLVVGAGQTLGEMTGYLAGYSGQELVDANPHYERLSGWMDRYGAVTIFVLGLVPNPLFDVAGIIAGALRMPVWKFIVSAGLGKILKNLAVAYGTVLSIEWLTQLFGG